LFRPPFSPHQAQRLTMIYSLAVCDAVAAASGLDARVKWPNDVLIGERKLCGILTELELEADKIKYAIVGIGLNINVDFAQAPPLHAPATSLLAETGQAFSRQDLLIVLLRHIEERYMALLDGRSFHPEWAARMATIGQPVQVNDGQETWHGQAIGLTPDGALRVRLPDGQIKTVLAGDVTLRQDKGKDND